jgi:hypothetical protein
MVPRPAVRLPQVAAAVGVRLRAAVLLPVVAATALRPVVVVDTVLPLVAATAVRRPAASVVLLPAVATARPAASVRLPGWAWSPVLLTACTR